MNYIKTLLAITLLHLLSVTYIYAQKPVYGFAYSTNLKDSVVYLTAIQQLPEAQIGKHNFLNHRADYAAQFSHYVQQYYDLPQVTTVVIFEKKRSKLEKRFLKIRKRARQEQAKRIVEISYSDFKFEPIK